MRSSQCSRSAGGSLGKYTHSPYSLSYSNNNNNNNNNNEVQNDGLQSRSEQNSQIRTKYRGTNWQTNNEERQYEMSESSKKDLCNASPCNDNDTLIEVHDKLSIPSTPLNMAVQDSLDSKERIDSNSSNDNNTNNISRTISSNTPQRESSASDGRMYNFEKRVNNNNYSNENCTPFSITTTSSSSFANCNESNSYKKNNNSSSNPNLLIDSNSMLTSSPTTVEASELSSSSLSMPINVHPTINVQPRHGRFQHGITRWNTTLNGLPLSPSSRMYQKSISFSSSSSPTYNIHTENTLNKPSSSNSFSASPHFIRSSSKRENNNNNSNKSKSDISMNVNVNSAQNSEPVNEALNRENTNINSNMDNALLESDEQLQQQKHQEESDQVGLASCSPSSMNYFQSPPAESVEQESDVLPSYPANVPNNTTLSHKVHPVPHTYAPARFMAKHNLTLANESTANAWTSSNSTNNVNNVVVNDTNNKNTNNSNLEDSNNNMEKSTSTLGSPFNRSYNESAQLSYNSGYSPLRHKSLSVTNNSITLNNNNNNTYHNNSSFSQFSSTTPAQTADLPLSVNVNYNHVISAEPSSYSPPYRMNYHNNNNNKNRSFSNYNSTGRNSYKSNSQPHASQQSNPKFNSGHYSSLSTSQLNTQLPEPTHSPSSSFVSSHYQQQHQQQQFNNSPPSAAASYNVSQMNDAHVTNAPSYMESTTQTFLANGVNNETNNPPYGFDIHTSEVITSNNNNNGNNFVNTNTSTSSAAIPSTANINIPFVASNNTTTTNNDNNFSSNVYNNLPGQTSSSFTGWDMNVPKPTPTSYNAAPAPMEYSSSSSPLSHKLITPHTLNNTYSSASAPRFNPHPMHSSSYNSHSYRSNTRRRRSFSLNNNNSFHKGSMAMNMNNNNSNNHNHNNEDTLSVSSKSCSNASSVRDNLELCPKDEECPLINDRRHQRQFAHTCRLFPCYHGHIIRHAKLFRHTEGQIAQQEGIPNGKISAHALTSVNFSSISPEAPNAYRIYVSHGEKSYEIFGDWASVRVHTFKRYLHQVCHIRPEAQVLIMVATNKIMDDEISSVKDYGVEADCEIQLKLDIELDEPGLLLDEL